MKIPMNPRLTKDLPLFDGSKPLPYIHGYRFKMPDGKTGTLISREAAYADSNGKLVMDTGLFVDMDP